MIDMNLHGPDLLRRIQEALARRGTREVVIRIERGEPVVLAVTRKRIE